MSRPVLALALAAAAVVTAPGPAAAVGPAAEAAPAPATPDPATQDPAHPDLAHPDLADALTGLDAPSAAERFAAERWLVANLGAVTPEDLVVALGAGDPGPEATWRLGRALGDARGTLGLVLELAAGDLADDRPPRLELDPLVPEPDRSTPRELARRLGDLALDQRVAAWREGLERLPMTGQELELFLREERERGPWTTLRHAPVDLRTSVDALDRRGDLPVPLLLAPELAARLARERFGTGGEDLAGPTLEGPWDRVLVDLAARAGVGLEAVLREGDEDGAEELAWLRLVPRGAEGRASGAEQVTEALRDLARGAPRADADGQAVAPAVHLQLAARFVAGTGWSEPLDWLAERWWSDRDPAALAGVLEAAGRGRLPGRMLSTRGLTRLLDEGRRLDGDGGGDVTHLVARLEHALARYPRQVEGGAVVPLLVDGLVDDGPLGRRLRLAALDAVGGGGGEGAAAARAVLAGDADAWTQWYALGVLGQARADDPDLIAAGPADLGAPETLLALVPDLVAPDELGRRLGRAGVAPADRTGDDGPALAAAWAGVRAVERRPAATRAVVRGLVLGGELEAAALLLVEHLDLAAPGSWAQSNEPGLLGRHVDELADALDAMARAGELVGVRALLGMAELRAAVRAPEPDPDRLGSGDDEPSALDRVALLAGALAPSRQALLVRALEAGEGTFLEFDLDALAVLAAAPAGAPVRALLLERLDRAFASPRPAEGAEVLPALERCIALLWARSDDATAEQLIQDVTRVAAGHSGSQHPLVVRVMWRRWPPAPAGTVLDLDRRTGP